jgi:transcriptional regulator with XRE-family HTH domain
MMKRRQRRPRRRTRQTVTRKPVTFGQNLRRLRLRAGLTQEALGDRLGHKRTTLISIWERTEKIPSPALITRIAKALGSTPADLLEHVETAYDRLRGDVMSAAPGAPVTDDEHECLHLYRQLPKQFRRHELAAWRSIVAGRRDPDSER